MSVNTSKSGSQRVRVPVFLAWLLGRGVFPSSPTISPRSKVQGVFKAVPPDGDVHVPGGVLGGAGAQAVEPQGIFVVVAGDVVVLAAGVQLAVHQLPVVPLLLLIPVHRAAPARVLHLDGAGLQTG